MKHHIFGNYISIFENRIFTESVIEHYVINFQSSGKSKNTIWKKSEISKERALTKTLGMLLQKD